MTQAFVNLGVTQAMTSNVGSLVQDLVEMAEAVKLVPQLKEQLNQATAQAEHYAKHVEELEINAINRKAEIDRLNDRIRSLEVERDDASFRVLEAEDKTASILQEASVMRTHLDTLIAFVDPPKPQPVEKIEFEVQFPDKDQFQDQSVKDPTANTGHLETGALTNPAASMDVGSTSMDTSPVEGQKGSSETDPTTNATDGGPKSEQTSVTSSVNPNATSPEDQSESNPTANVPDMNRTQSETASVAAPIGDTASTNPEPPKGPYFDKRYDAEPAYISRADWLAGGGTDESYDWRPSPF